MGCARDIVENVGVPRFWWSDFPLGHSAGKPHDPASQTATLEGALGLLDSCAEPRSTVTSPQVWSGNESWKKDFMDTSALDADTLAKMRAAHERDRTVKQKN